MEESANIDVNSNCVKDAIKFVCWLYDVKCKDFDINALRYKLFCQKSLSGQKLPPTYDALVLHIARAAYQTHIWRNSCVPVLNVSSPVENGGWKLDDNDCVVQNLMLQDPAPKEIVELIVCHCKTGCTKNTCPCKKNALCCTAVCSFIDCTNDAYEADDDWSSDDDEEKR